MNSKQNTSSLLCRRRARDSSLNEAKENFVRVVSDAVQHLEQEHGYSRDRATRALLQEIASVGSTEKPENGTVHSQRRSGDEKVSITPGRKPSRHLRKHKKNLCLTHNLLNPRQVSVFMQKYGISSDQALRAFSVSQAIDDMCRQHKKTVAQVVVDLTARLQHAQLLEHGATIAPVTSQPKSPASSRILTVPATRDCRVRPRQSKPTASSKVDGHRKRTLEASKKTTTTADATTTRTRADSVTEAVTAKLADTASSTTAATTADGRKVAATTTPSGRNKRSHSLEDAETAPQNKRVRHNNSHAAA